MKDLSMLPLPSPSAFELPSPISDFSSLSDEHPFDLNSFVDDCISPTALTNNPFDNTASWSTLFGEDSPTTGMDGLDSPSPPSSSSPSSPREIKTEKKTKASRKHSPTLSLGRVKSHNLIEKRYRNNLNSRIMTLRDCIPSLRCDSSSEGDSTSDAKKFSKGSILEKAISYIAELENGKKKLEKENARLRAVVASSKVDMSHLYASGLWRRNGMPKVNVAMNPMIGQVLA
jgi:hypothetical protein